MNELKDDIRKLDKFQKKYLKQRLKEEIQRAKDESSLNSYRPECFMKYDITKICHACRWMKECSFGCKPDGTRIKEDEI